MRTLAVAMLLALAWIAAKPGVAQQSVAQSATGTLTISLSNFAFDPEHIRLKVNTPIRLRLVNESGGGHSFSAPTFFAASSLEPGSSVPTGGKVEVGSHQTVDIILAPRVPGQYRVECTHFLHTLFGMRWYHRGNSVALRMRRRGSGYAATWHKFASVTACKARREIGADQRQFGGFGNSVPISGYETSDPRCTRVSYGSGDRFGYEPLAVGSDALLQPWLCAAPR